MCTERDRQRQGQTEREGWGVIRGREGEGGRQGDSEVVVSARGLDAHTQTDTHMYRASVCVCVCARTLHTYSTCVCVCVHASMRVHYIL